MQCFGIIILILIIIISIIIDIFFIIITNLQVFLKSKIMDNIHKYYFLIAFTAYMRYYKRQYIFTSFVNLQKVSHYILTTVCFSGRPLSWRETLQLRRRRPMPSPVARFLFFRFINRYEGVINLKVSQKISLRAN